MTENTAKQLKGAVEALAIMFREVPACDIITAFQERHESADVNRLLAMADQWHKAFTSIGELMGKHGDVVAKLISQSNAMKVELRPTLHALQGFITLHDDLKALADTLDRLEKHRQSGLLEVVTALKNNHER